VACGSYGDGTMIELIRCRQCGEKEDREYASNFDNQYQTVILKVEEVTEKANGRTS
jgi:hypothetical protein